MKKLKPCPFWLLVVTSGIFITTFNSTADKMQEKIGPCLTGLAMFAGAVLVAAITGVIYGAIAAWNRRAGTRRKP